jgi:hypothetical protein
MLRLQQQQMRFKLDRVYEDRLPGPPALFPHASRAVRAPMKDRISPQYHPAYLAQCAARVIDMNTRSARQH